MDTHIILAADYLDLIYEGRNKSYGSYELRRNYARRIRTSLFLLALTGISIATYGWLTNRVAPSLPEPPKPHLVSCPMTPLDLQPVPPPSAPSVPPPARSTVKVTIPRIDKDENVRPDELPPDLIASKNATPGVGTNTGSADGQGSQMGGQSDGTSSTLIATPPAPKESIPFAVDQMPEFNGDVQAWLANNVTYPDAAREVGSEGRVVIKFVVAEDGSVTDAQVERGVNAVLDAEALRAIRKMPKWKPGKQNGRAVKVYYRVPVTFQLD
ncbi:MAG: energy transducer TonB [Sphingobacteriales bacterium]|nr:MAG: energy transducer TonB [Sphingobacteriales bacterium]